MAILKGLRQLEKSLENLKANAEQLRENLDEKSSWWNGKTECWQESDDGQEWLEHLYEVENLLENIDNLELLDA